MTNGKAPIVFIGHSFGGMIAEKLLGMDYGAAAIGIDAAQIKGVLPLPLSSLRSTLPVFKNPANIHRAVSLTAKEFHYSFGNALSEEESNDLYERWTIPAPGRPLFEAATANFSPHSPDAVNTGNEGRGPLLLIMGKQDHTVPEAITKSTVKQYRHSSAVTELAEFDRSRGSRSRASRAGRGRAGSGRVRRDRLLDRGLHLGRALHVRHVAGTVEQVDGGAGHGLGLPGRDDPVLGSPDHGDRNRAADRLDRRRRVDALRLAVR
jgi:Alpha/beta hydrolase family